MNHWEIARSIQRTLIQHDYPTYITGGAVRDRLMGMDSADIDLATLAGTETVQKLFRRTEPVGVAFGTVLVIEQGIPFEVTSVRADTIEEDLGRRDFSINAMALDEYENVIDPFDGKVAIDQKKIETVNEPDITLRDDPLRMLRALRFSLQFSFEESESIYQWTTDHYQLLNQVSIERIVKEWDKISNVHWDLLKVHKLLSHPLTKNDSALFSDKELRDALMISGFPVESLTREQWWMFALFVKNDLEKAYVSLNQLKLSNAVVIHIKRSWEMAASYFQSEGHWTDRQLFDAGEQSIYDACLMIQMYLHETSCFRFLPHYRQLPIHSKNDLQVDGYDLIRHFPDLPRRSYKTVFSKMIDAVLCGRLKNETQTLLEWVEEVNL